MTGSEATHIRAIREELRLIALLAGVGPVAASLAERVDPAHGDGRQRRTCVDGDSQVLVTVEAPGARTLILHARQADPVDDGSRWSTFGVTADGVGRTDDRLLFRRPSAAASAAAEATARVQGVDAELEAWQARLEGLGWMCTVGDGIDGPTVGWSLARSTKPARAFAMCGLGRQWEAASAVIDALHGGEVSSGFGPWWVTMPLDPADDRVWFGTSRWGIYPDDAMKRRRLSETVRLLGGDECYAAALFHLLAGDSDGWARRVGRAVEVACIDNDVVGLRAHLGVLPRLTATPERSFQ